MDPPGRLRGLRRCPARSRAQRKGAVLRARPPPRWPRSDASLPARADRLSLAIFPAVDGAQGAPCVFDSGDDEAGAPAQLRSMALESSQVLEGGVAPLPAAERLTRASGHRA
jgi:hypothetical protein